MFSQYVRKRLQCLQCVSFLKQALGVPSHWIYQSELDLGKIFKSFAQLCFLLCKFCAYVLGIGRGRTWQWQCAPRGPGCEVLPILSCRPFRKMVVWWPDILAHRLRHGLHSTLLLDTFPNFPKGNIHPNFEFVSLRQVHIDNPLTLIWGRVSADIYTSGSSKYCHNTTMPLLRSHSLLYWYLIICAILCIFSNSSTILI